MQNLASFAGGTGRVRRPHHHWHAADCGHVELETLAPPQSRRLYDLDFGQLVVPAADTINGIRAEMDATPEFTDSELRGWRNAANVSIVASPQNVRGADL
jgi:hypothetical protein